MITVVDIRTLPPALRQQVMAAYKVHLQKVATELTYAEAAWLYGFQVHTLHMYTSKGIIAYVRRRGRGYIKHDSLRSYLRNRKATGRPRKAIAEAQTTIA